MSRSGKQSAPEQFVDTNSKQFTVNRSIVAYTPKSSWTPTCRPRTTSNITALSIQDIDQKSIKHIQNAIRIIFYWVIMPICWKFLYTPRREGESEKDKILRKLSFKLPAVVRYNVIFALFFGIFGAFYTKNMKTIMYFYRFLPITIPALCYEEIYRYYCFSQGMPPPIFNKPKTAVDLIREQ